MAGILGGGCRCEIILFNVGVTCDFWLCFLLANLRRISPITKLYGLLELINQVFFYLFVLSALINNIYSFKTFSFIIGIKDIKSAL